VDGIPTVDAVLDTSAAIVGVSDESNEVDVNEDLVLLPA
jgi:hypothetical protein